MSTESVSRREFLLRTAATSAATGAAFLPGIIVLSEQTVAAADNATANRATADKTTSVKADPKVAEYTVHCVSKTAAPDGRSREVFCYDGKIPGPVIRAKEGQTFKIKVVNQLKIPSSIHWHGMHQPGTWQMDGVDGVSRPPIPPGEEFTYEFKATPAGTHWYHSHTGVQYSDGLFGPLIVDEATPPAKYDREEILFINDWFLAQSDAILAGLLKKSDKMAGMAGAKKPGDGGAMPKDMGMKDMATKGMTAKDAGKKSDGMNSVMAPKSGAKSSDMKADGAKSGMAGMAMGAKPDYGDVPFESGLINGQGHFGKLGESTPAVVKVKRGETLRLRLISGASTYQFRFQIDGHPLTVIASDGAPLTPVEVDSLVLSPGERYDVLLKANGNKSTWIRAATLDGNEVKAILLYTDGRTGELPSGPVAWGKRDLKLAQMKSPKPVQLDENPQEIKLTLGGTMSPYAWNINGQEWPKADPIKLSPDLPVRFIMENPTMMDHPFHLHGHYFRVLGTPDNLNLTDPPEKDSINIPAKSTVVLQWKTINPGNWFYHCHIEWHLATGMARVIEIA